MKRDGGAPTLKITISMLPSLLMSPKATPRREYMGPSFKTGDGGNLIEGAITFVAVRAGAARDT